MTDMATLTRWKMGWGVSAVLSKLFVSTMVLEG